MPRFLRLRSRLGRPSTRLAARLRPGDAVIDVGCGPGTWLATVARLRPDLVLAGVDRWRDPALPAGADFTPLDLEHDPLPYPDAGFRLLNCAHVLEHLHDPGHALAELRRLVADDGLIYLEVPSERTLGAPSMPPWLAPAPPLAFADDPGHVGCPYSPDALATLLHGHGFRVQACGRARSPGLWPASPALLVGGSLARNGRWVHRALEQLGGLASYALVCRR